MHPSVYCRPFMDFTRTFNATQLDFYSDASKNFSLGFGAICEKSWMQHKWTDVNVNESMNPSIQYLELYAFVAAVLAWIHRFQNKRIIIFCDNEAVVNIINNSSSTCKNCMVLVRFITLHCLIFNVRLFAKHVSSKNNAISDSLSRFQDSRFAELTADRSMDIERTPVPNEIWNVKEFWLY